MIPALGAGGRGFDSRIAPFLGFHPVFKNTGVIDKFMVGTRRHLVNDSMAQWQRVGFQSRRLRVRFPLGSFLFFFCSFFLFGSGPTTTIKKDESKKNIDTTEI